MSNLEAVPLSELFINDAGVVVRLEGGHGLVGRLAALGFTPGATVQVVRNDRHGPIIARVLDTQIALGRGQACRVFVRREGR
ncbi:MAG: FeoA family protein [Anaerolineae bacterium]